MGYVRQRERWVNVKWLCWPKCNCWLAFVDLWWPFGQRATFHETVTAVAGGIRRLILFDTVPWHGSFCAIGHNKAEFYLQRICYLPRRPWHRRCVLSVCQRIMEIGGRLLWWLFTAISAVFLCQYWSTAFSFVSAFDVVQLPHCRLPNENGNQ